MTTMTTSPGTLEQLTAPPMPPAPAEPGRPGQTWTSATLSTLAYTLFAVQQPGPVSDLRTRDEAQAEGLFAPATTVTASGPEADSFLRRQNVLGEISLLDL